MNVLFDTNVILDVMLDRAPFSEPASLLLSLVEQGDIKGFICATTITTIHYLAAKNAGQNHARNQIRNLITLFNIAPVNRPVIENALKSKARRYDPDFHQDESDELLQKRRARLVKIRESYDTLKPLLSVGVNRGHHINRPRQKVIAIGGAKGGIGKSILANNK